MVTTGVLRFPGRPEEPAARDIQLRQEDRVRLFHEVARIFSSERAARPLLNDLGYPRARLPGWGDTTAEEWWDEVFAQLENGIVAAPYRTLIGAVLNRYERNTVIRPIAVAYGLVAAGPDDVLPDEPDERPVAPVAAFAAAVAAPPAAEPADTVAAAPPAVAEPPPRCHVILRASTEDARAHAAATLHRAGLRATEVWSTEHAVSYEVDSDDAAVVRQLLAGTGLGWTVVAPGQPNYLFRQLFFQGPDGSRFRVTDAPAQQTVGSLVTEVVEKYPSGAQSAGRPTVVDRVLGDGGRERLNPADTLHDANVQDGDNFRIAFEGRAGR
ncbi:effector-associated domain EAD1-containing protein [Dactylosporangium sp. NPDC049525]|uniref:effector-associated domain EAD1-containing protein n=1 Tax=Dactylosporangium sp. NPDC049525 TaxID=3154730 RepID=UPI0034183D4E